jgi:hypothetical protein
LNQSNQVITNFSGAVSLSGLNVAGETPVTIAPAVITNFVNGVWSGMVTAAQASAAMFLRADDQVGIRTDSAAFSVNVANDLVLAAVDFPGPGHRWSHADLFDPGYQHWPQHRDLQCC